MIKDRSKIDFIDGQLDGNVDHRQRDGLSLQAKREQITRLCECGCGREFTGIKTRRFYSDACRKRFKRAEEKANVI